MKKHDITLIPGDGVGPEITDAVVRVIAGAGVKVNWDIQHAGTDVFEAEGVPLPTRVIDSIKKNKVISRYCGYEFRRYSNFTISGWRANQNIW